MKSYIATIKFCAALGALLITTATALAQQPMEWTAGPAVLPMAMKGGEENGQPLYVCRARYQGGVHPGKIVSGHCNIGWGGKEITLTDFDVLSGAGTWGPPRTDFAGAYAAGHENGGPLYLCRARYNNGTHPGKVVNSQCHIGWGGREVALPAYEVFFAALRSLNSENAVKATFKNGGQSKLAVFWLDYHGREVAYGELAPGQQFEQDTFVSHPWVFKRGGRISDTYTPTRQKRQSYCFGC